MACELSSSYTSILSSSQEGQMWRKGSTYYDSFTQHRFGNTTYTLGTAEGVYTIVGTEQAYDYGPYTSWDQTAQGTGQVDIILSNSSGVTRTILTAEQIEDDGRTLPSNWVGVSGLEYNHNGGTDQNSRFGGSVAAVSSSNGIYIAVGAPGWGQYRGGIRDKGKVFLFLSNSSGVTEVGTITGSYEYSSIGGIVASNYWSGDTYDKAALVTTWSRDSVSLAIDDSGDLYMAFNDYRLSSAARSTSGYSSFHGGIQLWKSSSAGGLEHLSNLTASNEYAKEFLGQSNEIAFGGNNEVFVVAAGYYADNVTGPSGSAAVGRLVLFEYDTSTDTYTDTDIYPELNDANQLYDVSSGLGSFYFGNTVDMVSGSDGLYIAGGAYRRVHQNNSTYQKAYYQGDAYLFKRTESGVSMIDHFTGSHYGDDNTDQDYFGFNVQLEKTPDSVIVSVFERDYDSDAVTLQPRIWIYETGSAIDNKYQLLGPSGFGDWGRNFSMHKYENSLYFSVPDTNIDTQRGEVYTYEWGLSGSCSQQQQQGGQSMPIQQRGLAVYSGSNDSGNAVHKFIDDGTVQLGSSAQNASVTVTGSVSVSTLTAGRVAFAGTDGLLKDDADLQFSGDTLTATKIGAYTAAGTIDLDTQTLDVSAGTLTLADDQISGDKVEGGTIAAITISSLTATSADIDGGTINGVTMAESDVTVGSGKTLNVSAGTLTLADDQISGDKVEGGTIAAITISSLTATSADVDGGSIDDTTIGATTQSSGKFTTLSASSTFHVGGEAYLASARVDDLSNDQLVFAGTNGELEGSNDLTFDGSSLFTAGQLTASLGVSGSYFYGDGSNLTNISSENVDLTAADDATQYYLPLVAGTGDQDNEVMKNDSDGSLAFNTGDANNMPRLIVSGGVHLQRFNNGNNDDDSKLATLANSGDASPYNGMMIYVGYAYDAASGDASAAFFFDNGDKWYFCESGSWYPSSFNS